MWSFTNLCLTLSLALSFISPSLAHAHQGRRHYVHRQADLARRDPGQVNLYKRFDNVRITFYQPGLGACGINNSPSDFIAALNTEQYTTGSYCFQTITITVGGKTTQAQITDECMGCPYGGLDLSPGLFGYFADASVGVVTGSWEPGSGNPSPSPSPSPSPTPTSVYTPPTTWVPSPTTTSQPPPTATTSALPITSSSGSSSSVVSSSASSLVATQTTTNAVAATAGAVSVGTSNSSVLYDMTLSVVSIGELLIDCTSSQ